MPASSLTFYTVCNTLFWFLRRAPSPPLPVRGYWMMVVVDGLMFGFPVELCFPPVSPSASRQGARSLSSFPYGLSSSYLPPSRVPRYRPRYFLQFAVMTHGQPSQHCRMQAVPPPPPATPRPLKTFQPSTPIPRVRGRSAKLLPCSDGTWLAHA